jgi:hypothetical protein
MTTFQRVNWPPYLKGLEIHDDIAELRFVLGELLAALSMHRHHDSPNTKLSLERAEAEGVRVLGWDDK